MAQGRDPAALWKLALAKRKKQGPRWMELVKYALSESNPDAKKEQLGLVSEYLKYRHSIADRTANILSELRATFNADDNAATGQPLDLDAIEEYLDGEEEEDDLELIEKFNKNIKKHEEEDKKLEEEILKTTDNSTADK